MVHQFITKKTKELNHLSLVNSTDDIFKMIYTVTNAYTPTVTEKPDTSLESKVKRRKARPPSLWSTLSKEQQQCILSKEKDKNPTINVYSPYLTEPYPFSRALYASGNDYLLCQNLPDRHSDSLSCPVRFLHGLDDDVVPFETVTNAVKVLQEKFKAKDITVSLLGGGDHRLSRPEDIKAILKTLGELL